MSCPDENALAAHQHGLLEGEEAEALLAHLDQCASCRTTLAELVRAEAGNAPEPIGKGTMVGRYLVLERLGVGGMSVVFAAYDPGLDRKVALKLLRSDGLSEAEEERRGRLLREAQAMARLSHPGVIAVHDVGTWNGQVFIAMELVDGPTLAEWLNERARNWTEVLPVFLQAGRGLLAAHRAGLVHRDFKPDNVLLGRDGRVRVTDFGLAALPGAPAETAVPSSAAAPGALTQSGTVLGTPAFMAPEQFDGLPADARTDQFSFCVALFEALYRKRPFTGDTLQALAANARRAQGAEVPSDARVPPFVRDAVLRGLAARREDRFPSMEELLAALDWRPSTSRRWLVAVAGAILLAAAAGLAARGSPPPCQGAEAKLTGTWDGLRREAIRRAFEQSGVPFAADAFARVAQGLDAYARDWVAMHVDACEATRVRGEQSEELLDARMDCLHRRRTELEALTALFSRADAEVVQRAVVAVGELAPVRTCEASALRTRRGPDPAARQREEALRPALSEARALHSAGKFSLARAAAAKAVGRARELGDPGLQAEALILAGRAEDALSELPAAAGSFHQAAEAAIRADRRELTATAWTHLAATLARSARFEEAERFERYASAALRPTPGEEQEWLLESTRGVLRARQGRMADAEPHLRRALALAERVFGPEHATTALALNNLGGCLRDLDRRDDSLPLLERALRIRERVLGPEHPDVGASHANLAVVRFDRGDLEQTLAHHRRALSIFERSLGPNHPKVAKELTNMSSHLTDLGQPKEAVDAAERAVRIREATLGPENPDLASSLLNLGIALEQLGRCQEALTPLRRALAIGEKKLDQNDPRPALALAHLGVCELQLGSTAPARGLLERALAREAALRHQHLDRSSAQFALARILWTGRERDRARALLEAARSGLAPGTVSAQRLRQELDAWSRRHLEDARARPASE